MEDSDIDSSRLPVPLTVSAALLLAASLGGCRGVQSALDPAGPAAESIALIWWIMVVGAVAVWLLVVVLLWLALRRRDAELPRPAQPLRFIVGGGIVLPVVVLTALLVHGSLASGRITGIGTDVDRVIEVHARQWQWTFRYRDSDGEVVAETLDELVIPRGELVEFLIGSEDVIHSFWIPRLGGKIDAIPGRINHLRLQADRDVPIRGHCAEFCGLEHTHMIFAVEVMEPEQVGLVASGKTYYDVRDVPLAPVLATVEAPVGERHVAQVGSAVFIRRGANRDENNLAKFNSLFGIGGELQATLSDRAFDNVFQAGLKNGYFTRSQPLDLGVVNVNAHYIVT